MDKRIKLKRCKQKELLDCAKNEVGTWKELSKSTKFSEQYLKKELRNGKRTLTKSLFKQLCIITNKKYDKYVTGIMNPNWGRLKGAKNSSRTKAKVIEIIEPSEELAEIVGIMLGDGNIYKKQYAVRICGDLKKDRDYLLKTVLPLFRKVFGIELRVYEHKSMNEMILYYYGKFVAANLEYYGLKAGNKKTNNVKIPNWVLRNENFSKACLRGLFDTDGTVFIRNCRLKIEFSSAIPALQKSFEEAMNFLGFEKKWTKSHKNVKRYGLYSKKDIKRFINIINFNNPKHKSKCLGGVVA